MAGSLTETHYGVVRERAESDQRSLYSYTGEQPTYIAVVSEPRSTKIDEYCDEWWPELGMPEDALHDFWSYRQGYRTNSAVEYPTTRAWEDANLEYRYEKYLRVSMEAEKAIDRIVARLREGEDIALVCFEEGPKPCHRHILKEKIESRLSSKYDFTRLKV